MSEKYTDRMLMCGDCQHILYYPEGDYCGYFVGAELKADLHGHSLRCKKCLESESPIKVNYT